MIPDHVISPFHEVTRAELESIIYRLDELDEIDIERSSHIYRLEESVIFVRNKQLQIRQVLRRLMALTLEILKVVQKQPKINDNALVKLTQSFEKLSIS